MFYVYIIRSETHPDQTYVGFTEDLRQRLATHNQRGSPHTAKFAPRQIEFYSAFKREDKAPAFECYLKSHSDKAFASKRQLQTDYRSEQASGSERRMAGQFLLSHASCPI